MASISYSRIVDCSHPVSPDMPHWPGDPVTRFDVCASIGTDGYSLRSFSMSEHAGTHCNAPNSFFSHGADVAAVLSSPLCLPMVVADFSVQTADDSMAVFTPSHLALWEQLHGPVPSDSLFCLHCGWGEKWTNAALFLGTHAPQGNVVGAMHECDGMPALRFPAFAIETARILMHERHVAGIAIDTHGVDSPADGTFAVNRLVLEAGGLVLECLANLHLLPPVGCNSVIGGLRLSGGTGSPVSVFAFVP